MSQNELDDAEIARLLTTAVNSGRQCFPGREDLLSALVTEFERRSVEPGLFTGEELTVHEDLEPLARGSRRVVLGALAAGVLLVVGLAAALFGSDQSEQQTVDVAADGERRLVPAHLLPAPIAPEVHRTDVIGSGVELRLPAGFEVIEEVDGRLVLGRSGDASERRSTITMVEVVDTPELGALVDALVASDSVTAIATVDVTTLGVVRTWDLRLTNSGAAGCLDLGGCVPLGPVSLWANGVNLVTELITPAGDRVWWVEQSAVHLDPFLEEGAGVLVTLAFD